MTAAFLGSFGNVIMIGFQINMTISERPFAHQPPSLPRVTHQFGLPLARSPLAATRSPNCEVT